MNPTTRVVKQIIFTKIIPFFLVEQIITIKYIKGNWARTNNIILRMNNHCKVFINKIIVTIRTISVINPTSR